MSYRSIFGALGLALGLGGCGQQDLDLLIRVEPTDPCLAFVGEAGCAAQAALGCSFQPNTDGCLGTDAGCAAGQCRGGDAFVRSAGRSFVLHGEPFRFAGVSSWALLPATACTGIAAADREAWLHDAYAGLVPARAKVARFFAFQKAAGPSGTDFHLLDVAVQEARRAGVRLQLVLEHAEGGCSEGAHRDSAWYSGGFRSPDGNYALSYRDYAEALARRYHDEPTVLGYTLLQGLGFADAGAISGFVSEMGQLLHDVAPNQLLSLGLAWDSTGDDGGSSYRALERLPAVDFVDVADYAFAEPLEPLDATWLATLSEIDKPAVIAEGAFQLDGADPESLARRGEKARARMADWKQWGFSGALFWAYQPGWGVVSEEFDARPGDPLLAPGGVLASAPW